MKEYDKKCKINHLSYRSIQVKVKYSILLLQHRLKKLLIFQKKGGRGGGGNNSDFQSLIPQGRYSERSAQD